jgi:G3E family GTPase
MTRTHIITGSFGAGKTTAIRWLMAHKAPSELWVVILNEFTDAGLDALSVAQSARGDYDVRLVAGGCLCCAGELEFGKQVRDILRHLKPARLLIEPSGAAHAGAIADELAAYAAQGVLSLDGVICLLDPIDAMRLAGSRANGGDSARAAAEWAQIQSADVVLLSKPDLSNPAAQAAFDSIVLEQFPPKRLVGTCVNGAIPADALQKFERAVNFSPLGAVPTGGAPPVSTPFVIAGLDGIETQWRALGLNAVSWIAPGELEFSRTVIEPRLQWLTAAAQTSLCRLKAVFRTGPGPSWLIQSHGRGLAAEDSAYRRDSRLELVLDSAPTPEFLESWRALLRDAALPRTRGMRTP